MAESRNIITLDGKTMRTLAALPDERVTEIIRLARKLPDDYGEWGFTLDLPDGHPMKARNG